MDDTRNTTVGDVVKYVDPKGQSNIALVQTVWGGGDYPSLNVVFVSQDSAKIDQYGRQVEHATSVPHHRDQKAMGNYWLRLDTKERDVYHE